MVRLRSSSEKRKVVSCRLDTDFLLASFILERDSSNLIGNLKSLACKLADSKTVIDRMSIQFFSLLVYLNINF